MIGTDFSVVLLPTLACNAACDYCFEQHRVGMLDHERLELIVRQLLDVAQDQNLKRLNVFWQGGEVTLLSPEWFERAGEIFAEHLSDADVEVVHYLQIESDRLRPLVEPTGPPDVRRQPGHVAGLP